MRYPASFSGTNSITSPILTSHATQILLSTDSVTSSSRRSRVMVVGAMPAALRRSALLIFLSTSSFHSLLYEIAIPVRPPATNIAFIIHLSRSQGKRASHRVAKLSNFKKQLACKTLTHRSFVYFGSSFALRFPLTVNIIRAWDYPKIAACTDSGCACYSLKSQYPQIVMSPLFRKRGHFFFSDT